MLSVCVVHGYNLVAIQVETAFFFLFLLIWKRGTGKGEVEITF
jgi:hypothetical protein